MTTQRVSLGLFCVLLCVLAIWLFRPSTTTERVTTVPRPRPAVPTAPTVAPRKPPVVAQRSLPEPARVVQVEPPPVDDPMEDALGRLIVDIVDANGNPATGRVLPVDCPGFRQPTQGEVVANVGECTLRSVRRDGMIVVYGEPVTATIEGEDPGYLQLTTSEGRVGGIGVRFVPDELGKRIVMLVPGGPAEEAGLQVGDLITTVDGVPVSDLSDEEFVRKMTGTEGSSVEFGVEAELDTGLVREVHKVKRAYLSADS